MFRPKYLNGTQIAADTAPIPHTMPMNAFKAYTGAGETKIRELDKAGEIESVVVGGRRMYKPQSWIDYVEREAAKPQQDVRRNKTGVVPAWGEKRQGGQPLGAPERPGLSELAPKAPRRGRPRKTPATEYEAPRSAK